jgi:hypothetical protein
MINVSGLPDRVVSQYLMPTENVVLSVRMHPIAIFRPVVVIVVSLVGAGFVTGAAPPGDSGIVDLIWILWGVVFLWQSWRLLTWWRRYFVVTENRLMLITSLVDTDVGMMPLAKVTDMRFHQSTFGRVFAYGEFIVESAGQDQALSHVQPVPYPSEMYQEILALIFPPKPGAPALRPGPSGRSGPSGSGPSGSGPPGSGPSGSGPSGPTRPSWPAAPASGASGGPQDDPGY